MAVICSVLLGILWFPPAQDGLPCIATSGILPGPLVEINYRASQVFPSEAEIGDPLLALFGLINSLVVIVTCFRKEVLKAVSIFLRFSGRILQRIILRPELAHFRKLLKVQNQQCDRERGKDETENCVDHLSSPNKPSGEPPTGRL